MIFALASPSSSTSVDSWRVRNASTEAVETIDKPLGSLWRQRPDARRGPAPNPSPSFASPNWRHHPPPPHSSSSMTALSQSPITPQTPQFIMASTSSSPHHNSNYASSIYSTAGTSMKSSGSSTFTRFSNASVSTFATTVSASSGSTPVSVPARPVVTRPLPRNVKPLQGVPWLLGEPPQRTNGKKSEGDVRRRKAQPSNLDPISERPKKWSGGSGSGSESEGESSAAATLSTTAATTAAGSSSAGTVGQQQRQGQTQQAQSSSQSQSQSSSGGVPKKVQKGQIATLAKVLSSIRRKD
ncbi:uncharacterized protein EI90DRAFT_285895 [Cantharellus anzutake]|uniref:uncharacterized protein n=1 Tax=Cantharellus anzutake TaxID=1750568 RepID=UPI0019074A95|nr:uncharacterized protein EI90DRAFT_285895 [Cantharellus anzutake]KAF8335984.1 hypothetical protein EI90DRAFT_285895 [Cantharellus anzutake]